MPCFDVFARPCAGAPFAVSFGRCGDTAAQLLVVMLWHAMARQLRGAAVWKLQPRSLLRPCVFHGVTS